jgi:tRNA threonylcarbamoyladenosine biosynthesis protein TsaE
MKLPVDTVVSSEKETEMIAAEFVDSPAIGDVVCLNGNLGCGKTYFVKSFCKAIGIDTASSPSFALVNEYHGKRKIVHFDFYRIKKVEELSDIGFEQYLSDGDSIVFIEWANLFPIVLPKKYFLIQLEILENEKRSLKITKHG